MYKKQKRFFQRITSNPTFYQNRRQTKRLDFQKDVLSW